VGHARRFHPAHLLELEVANVLEQPLAATEQDGDEVELELIDQAGGEILLDEVGASPEEHILAAHGVPRLLERGLDPIGDEDEGGASLHLQRLAGMVGEHEDRRVEERVVAPPHLSREGPRSTGPGRPRTCSCPSRSPRRSTATPRPRACWR
jgi:hypothetical protein